MLEKVDFAAAFLKVPSLIDFMARKKSNCRESSSSAVPVKKEAEEDGIDEEDAGVGARYFPHLGNVNWNSINNSRYIPFNTPTFRRRFNTLKSFRMTSIRLVNCKVYYSHHLVLCFHTPISIWAEFEEC